MADMLCSTLLSTVGDRTRIDVSASRHFRARGRGQCRRGCGSVLAAEFEAVWDEPPAGVFDGGPVRVKPVNCISATSSTARQVRRHLSSRTPFTDDIVYHILDE
jgi:hypothetical protein